MGNKKRTERGTVLDEAKIIINGERQDQYGNPEDNFALIARLWSAVTGQHDDSGAGDGQRLLGGGVRFERIRRITGYLVGTLDRFNDAKRAEERERVKHQA